MAAERKVITFFLEDVAQEAFVTAVVDRLALEVGLSVDHDPRSVLKGGHPLPELKRFLRDEKRRPHLMTDLLIISIDGNCMGHNAKRQEITDIIAQAGYTPSFVCAVLDPHIERWYLCDGEAVREALSASVHPVVPPYKCARDQYKALLRRAIQDAGLDLILGGAEHGEAIVQAMDLYKVGKNEPSLGQFLEDLRSALQSLVTRP